jgi:aminopeptidase N
VESAAAEADTVVVAEADTVQADTTYAVLSLDRSGFAPPERQYDLLHTGLDLRVDLEQGRLEGAALHRLTPLGQTLDELRFDAADLDVALVTLTQPTPGIDRQRTDTLRFDHGSDDLRAFPVESVSPEDTVTVRILYSAVANDAATFPFGFVKPSAPTRAGQAHQAWTFGFPENSQRWFPTWDYPHELATYEIALTVPDSLTTLATGALAEQVRLGDGMRRDRWVLDAPQPAYLTSFAVGDFVVRADTLRRADGTTVPLWYATEPGYHDQADLIFGETPQMLEVFEDKAGLRYPWPNLKQVPVRDFPAGGMEHTTNIFYTETIQGDARAYRDIGGRMRSLVAHEIAHQWFGDLVVYENWANAALTEGFATFLESVYLEEAYGAAEGQALRITDRERYLEAAETMRRPIIWYGYEDPVQMYDAHSYQKAALVLQQLRQVMGEDAFWRGVRRYLRSHRGGTVTISDFQRAMEAETGGTLQPYVDQWFRSPGHPELRVTHTSEENDNLYRLRVEQVQDTARTALFDFEVDVELNFYTLEPFTQRVRVNTPDTTFVFTGSSPISFVRFNAGDWLLADVKVDKPVDEWITQLRRDDEMAGRYQAADALARQEPAREIRDALAATARNDDAPMVRARAVEGLASYGDQSYAARVLSDVAQDDSVASVRRAALTSMHRIPAAPALEAASTVLNDSTASYRVLAAAIQILAERDPENALKRFEPLYDLQSWNHTVERALVAAVDSLGQPEGLPYLLGQLRPDTPDGLVLSTLDAAAPHITDTLEAEPSVVGLLTGLLTRRSEAVRLRTVGILGTLSAPTAAEALRQHRQNESSPRVRQAIDRALERSASEGP